MILLITIFDFSILGFDIKIILLPILVLFYITSKPQKQFSRTFFILLIYLLFIIFYSFLIQLLLRTNNLFEVLRSIRSLLSLLSLTYIYDSFKNKTLIIIQTFKFLIFLHALSIIISIFSPEFENLLVSFNNYSKEQLPLRSTGFSSGYDDAGFIIILLISFQIIDFINKKKSFFNFNNLVLIIAVFFTSRFNMGILFVVFLVKIFYEFFYLKKRSIFYPLTMTFVLFLLITMISITIDYPKGFREILFEIVPPLENAFLSISSSYSDYGIYNYIIGQHIEPLFKLNLIEFVFGKGLRVSGSDIGYIKSIYSIGLIGTFTQYLVIYFFTVFSKKNKFYYYLITFILLSLIIEVKMQFLFSSGGFEIMVILLLFSNQESKQLNVL